MSTNAQLHRVLPQGKTTILQTKAETEGVNEIKKSANFLTFYSQGPRFMVSSFEKAVYF